MWYACRMPQVIPHTPKPLTPRQQLFVHEFLIDLCAAAAARRAGFSDTMANTQAHLWVGADRGKCPLTYQKVWDAVQAAKAARVEKVDIDAEFVLKKLYEAVSCDISQAFGPDGSLLPIKDMPKPVAWLLAGFEGMGLTGYTEAERRADEEQDLREWKEECEIAKASNKSLPRKPKPRISFTTSKVKFIDRSHLLKMLGDHIKVQAFRQNFKTDQPPSQTIINNGPAIPQDQLDQLLALGENLSIVEALANAALPASAIPTPDATPTAAPGNEPGTLPAPDQPDASPEGLHSPPGDAGQENQGQSQP